VKFLQGLPLVTTPGKPKRGEALRVNDRFQVMDESFANRLWVETGLRELVCGCAEGVDAGEVMSNEERRQLWGGEPVGLNPSIRIYRYTKGQFFDCHCKYHLSPFRQLSSDITITDDESNVLTLDSKPVKTTWTMLLYLTSPATGCQGGETVFYPDELPGKKSVIEKEVVVELETGMALLHKHGNDCMLVSISGLMSRNPADMSQHEGREVKEGEKWVIRTDLCVKREKPRFAD